MPGANLVTSADPEKSGVFEETNHASLDIPHLEAIRRSYCTSLRTFRVSKEILEHRKCECFFGTKGKEGNATKQAFLGQEVNLDYRCLCLAT